jgi:UDPglucose 6-dehydrogenase
MSKIKVIGAGYVGLTTAICLAYLGHDVNCSDVNFEKINNLQSGISPIEEDGLEALLKSALVNEKISFTTSNIAEIQNAEYVFLCLPTPQGDFGRADMSYIKTVAKEIGTSLASGAIVINKSTVPVGSTIVVENSIKRDDVAVISNPEFLREGFAVRDFLHPDRIIIGSNNQEASTKLSLLYSTFDAPVMVTDPCTAETVKYASNAFLATKISFINEVAALCEVVGADVRQVVAGMSYDPRIGSSYLSPGPGWGGSCLPKDVAALIGISEEAGLDFSLLKEVCVVNEMQLNRIIKKIEKACDNDVRNKKIALLGLTFKANTDDRRNSPSIDIGKRLLELGATIVAYDPTVKESLKDFIIADTAYEACFGTSCVVLATEWDEFKWLDYKEIATTMLSKAIVDARNLLNPQTITQLGFHYQCIGLQ